MYKIFKTSLIKFTVFIAFIFSATNLMAANETIEMLNKLGKEHMVYSQKIVNIEVGDTIFWKSTTPGR